MKLLFYIGLASLCLLVASTNLSARKTGKQDPLTFHFDKQYGQVEVGGPFAGAEFHESRPLPARISFYYPVANSIDLSTDYWKRGDSRPFALGLRIGNGSRQWIGRDAWTYDLSPHRVSFAKSVDGIKIRISYEFCPNEPALVQSVTFVNSTRTRTSIELYTHVKATLRTCQTYAREDSALVEYNSSAGLFTATYAAAETGPASVFMIDAGYQPNGFYTDVPALSVTDSGTSVWIAGSQLKTTSARFAARPPSPIVAESYSKTLRPGDSLIVIHVIGSCRPTEVKDVVGRLKKSWKKEIAANDRFVRGYAAAGPAVKTNDPVVDRSARWAGGILASNRHYLDGTVIPMPCPAEYNFYFTHDLLLTDLGAVNFDAARVKRDLLYVIAHSKANVIPHAYYWRDKEFQTEYCDSANWNHLWFIIASARYHRHTGDDSTLRALYPFITRSLTTILSQRHADSLMYAYRPDWWDIGRKEGPRSYITILTIRALRDYLYMSSVLRLNGNALPGYERAADGMEEKLVSGLWDDSLKYLINYNDGVKDRHYYMGSLLGPVYGMLDSSRSASLLETATRQMLRPHTGIMVVAPPDFSTDSMKSFFHFVDNETGDPYLYINGGIWPHANAFYAMGLASVGRSDEALRFTKEMMTIDGIATSPNGVPAMYEYRFSDSSSREYGKIDKPSFMWAAGFYLNTLYTLCGFRDNEWNLSVGGVRPSAFGSVTSSWLAGKNHAVRQSGGGETLSQFLADGKVVPSEVIPLSVSGKSAFGINYGAPKTPYLRNINAVLVDVKYDGVKKLLSAGCSSFDGHIVTAGIVSPLMPSGVSLNGNAITSISSRTGTDGLVYSIITFTGTAARQNLEIQF